MNDFAFEQSAPRNRSAVDLSRVVCNELRVFPGVSIARFVLETFALRSPDYNRVRLAKASRRFDQCIKHCLQIEGRSADDLEHIGGGGLLLQRFAQLVEQARVLDGDNGL